MAEERNFAQQLYYKVCEDLDQQMDETIEVKEERNRYKEERDRYKKERNQLKEKLDSWKEGETTNTDVWAEMMVVVDSQSLIKQMQEDYEKRKKDIDETRSSKSAVEHN